MSDGRDLASPGSCFGSLYGSESDVGSVAFDVADIDEVDGVTSGEEYEEVEKVEEGPTEEAKEFQENGSVHILRTESPPQPLPSYNPPFFDEPREVRSPETPSPPSRVEAPSEAFVAIIERTRAVAEASDSIRGLSALGLSTDVLGAVLKREEASLAEEIRRYKSRPKAERERDADLYVASQVHILENKLREGPSWDLMGESWRKAWRELV